ncbi:hypothetical protein EDB84DRAFT_828427 [Lactarius hengduanensis]|nr:hypothetical protein EDB84DRAFT_828427 [Lactarius hengduanensis]
MPMSDFEYLPSATVDQPAPTLSSTPPSASSISSMFLPSPARLATEDLPEPESASTPSITPSSLILPLTHSPSPSTDDVPELVSAPLPLSSIMSTDLERVPSPVILAVDDVPEPEFALASLVPPSIGHVPVFAPTPHVMSSVSLTNFECPPSEIVDQPEFEPEHASLSSTIPTSPSLPAPSLALEFTDDVRALSPLPLLEISTLGSLPVALSPDQSFKSLPLEVLGQSPRSCGFESTPGSAADVVTLSHPELPLSSLGEPIPFLPASLEAPPIAHISPRSTPPQRPPKLKTVGSDSSPLEIAPVPANLAPSPSTFRVVFSASNDLSSASPPSSLVLGNLELEFFPTPSSAVEIVPQSSPELSESESSLYEVIPFLPAPLDISITTPIPRHSTSSQRPPRLGYRHSPLVYEAPSTRLPTLAPPSLLSLRLSSASTRFNFALSLITVAALVSTLFNASTTLSTLAQKYWNKNEDFGNSQIGTLNTSSRDVFAEQLRLGRYTPRASRFVSTPEASPQVPNHFRHMKTFASASRRHATASSHARHRHPHSRSNQTTSSVSIPEA